MAAGFIGRSIEFRDQHLVQSLEPINLSRRALRLHDLRRALIQAPGVLFLEFVMPGGLEFLNHP